MKSSIIIFYLFSSIFATIYAITFDCTFEISEHYIGVGPLYRCRAEISGIFDSRNLTDVSGDHLVGKNNTDVGEIFITGYTDLDFVPQGMIKFFPNLVAIGLIYSGIRKLNGDELHEYPRLKMTTLSHGQLERISGNLFQKTPEMVIIVFFNNSIIHVGDNLLNNLENLDFVNFLFNACIDMQSINPFDRLIENLRTFCRDVETTTQTPEITSSTQLPGCRVGYINKRICILEEDNERLWQENVEIRNELVSIKEEKEEMRQRLNEIEDMLRELRPPSLHC